MAVGLRARYRCWAVLLAALVCRRVGAQDAPRPEFPARPPAGKAEKPEKKEERDPLIFRLVQKGERTGAPLQVELEFDWEGPALIEGNLELDFLEKRRHLGTLVVTDLALPKGTQRFAAILPAMSVAEPGEYLTARPKFRLKNGTVIFLDPQLLAVPNLKERTLLVCAPNPDLRALGVEAEGFSRAVRFEQWNPVSRDRSLLTGFVRPTGGEVPDSPLGYLPFDLVLLDHDAFREMQDAQLAALADWIEAGGGLLVIPRGVLRDRHRLFLDRLAESAGSPLRFAMDGAGRFLPLPEAATTGLVRLRAGLGRAVVVLPSDATRIRFDGAAWKEAALFLWRMRRDRSAEITGAGSWSLPPWKPRFGIWRGDDSEPADRDPLALEVMPLPLGDWLVTRLLPRTVRTIPFGSIVAVLAVFVLAVGPLDWFLLGYLRKRKWTWILFPALSVACALFVVVLSRHHLGTATQRRSLVLVDVGPDGKAQRENRFELIFPATSERLTQETSGALLQPLDASDGESASRVSGRGAGWRGGISAATRPTGEPVRIAGRFPYRYAVSQSLYQWKAQVNRSLSFAAPSGGTGGEGTGPQDQSFSPRWGELEALFPLLPLREGNAPRLADDLVARFLKGEDVRCRILVLHGDQTLEWTAAGMSSRPARPPPDFMSIHPSAGLFHLVAATSPTGNADCGDLALLDSTDPDEFLVLVEREVGDTVIIHRKLYRRRD